MNFNNKFLYYRAEIGSITLSMLVSLYILGIMNRTFFSKMYENFHHSILLTAILAIILFCLFTAFTTMLSVKYIIKPIFILLILIGSVTSWFTDKFGVIIDEDMIRNVLESTHAEVKALVTVPFLIYVFVTGIIPSILFFFLRVRHRNWWPKVAYNAAIIIFLLVVSVVTTFSFSKQLIPTIRAYRYAMHTINPFTAIISAIKYKFSYKNINNIVVMPIGTDAKVDGVPLINHNPRVLIVVAGETARANNFSLGGYKKETNPELSKRNVLYFDNTNSCGTVTEVSIPCMFSIYPKSEYSFKKGRTTETLPDVLHHAGIYVEWWDNNTGSKDVAKRIKNVLFFNSKSPRFCNEGECQDGIMLDKIGEWLDNVKTDSVLFLHQLGSHGPAYYRRYPDNFRHFQPECREKDFNNCSMEAVRNAYDNTILYTDYFLSKLIDELVLRSQKMSGAIFYMSDHGESLGEGGLFLHGTPYMFAPRMQTHIPFVIWMSPDFSKTASIDQECIKRTKLHKEHSHDNLFHSVLSMMNVNTSIKNRKLDIFADCKENNNIK